MRASTCPYQTIRATGGAVFFLARKFFVASVFMVPAVIGLTVFSAGASSGGRSTSGAPLLHSSSNAGRTSGARPLRRLRSDEADRRRRFTGPLHVVRQHLHDHKRHTKSPESHARRQGRGHRSRRAIRVLVRVGRRDREIRTGIGPRRKTEGHRSRRRLTPICACCNSSLRRFPR